MKKIIFLLCLGFALLSKAQPKPLNDSTWQLAFADEFNTGTKPDSTVWWHYWGNNAPPSRTIYKDYINGDYDTVTHADQWAYISPFFQNCPVDSGSLKITSRKENLYSKKVWDGYYKTVNCYGNYYPDSIWCPNQSFVDFKYSTGFLMSQRRFKYGYYEIRMKLPDAAASNANKGLGPNFWLYHATDTTVWSEIDIYEFAGKQMPSGQLNYHTSNVHYQKLPPDSFGTYTLNPLDTTHSGDPYFALGTVSFSSNYRTFGIDWRPDKIDFYLDGNLYRTSSDPGIFPNKLNEMHLFIDINHPTLNFNVLVDTVNTIFPFEYDIDYVRCWQYKHYCDSVLNQCNFNSATFDPAVYKQISVGGSGCTAPIPTGKNISFRANDFVLLQEGFEVQAGAEFLGDVTPCYEYVNPNRSAPPVNNPFFSPFFNQERIKNKNQ